MAMKPYDVIRYLQELKRARQENPSDKKSCLEEDFLFFSSQVSSRELAVRLPKLYPVKDEEKKHLSEALVSLGIKTGVPEAVDISGGFDYNNLDNFIFLGLGQLNADHFSRTRSFLNPLIEKIYSEGTKLLRDFTINDALVGKVDYFSGNLDLREVHIFPERFLSSAYQLRVTLETPNGTVRDFAELTDLFNEIEGNPKSGMLDTQKISRALKLGVDLRKRLGSLARYDRQEKCFSIQTNSCVLFNSDSTYFYLYTPSGENVLVYFGAPLSNFPRDLILLDGDEHEKTLARLVELGVYLPSYAVLGQRIDDLGRIFDNAARAANTNIKATHPNIPGALDKLNAAKAYFERTENQQMRREYVISQPSELLEFMVCPVNEDPVLHELLPRISWNKSLRSYQNTSDFIRRFNEAGEPEKIKMLNEVVSSISFNNHQNNDVNCWLYNNHRDFCSSYGVKFNLAE